MADRQEASVTLPSDPVSVSTARRYAADVLGAWRLPGDGELRDSVRLIVSELATNAVQHTFGQSPTFRVDLFLEEAGTGDGGPGTAAGRLLVGVTDSHPRWPRRLPAAVRQDNGRGMGIIRSLTAHHGGRMFVSPTEDGGKTVWVVLPLPLPEPEPLTEPALPPRHGRGEPGPRPPAAAEAGLGGPAARERLPRAAGSASPERPVPAAQAVPPPGHRTRP